MSEEELGIEVKIRDGLFGLGVVAAILSAVLVVKANQVEVEYWLFQSALFSISSIALFGGWWWLWRETGEQKGEKLEELAVIVASVGLVSVLWRFFVENLFLLIVGGVCFITSLILGVSGWRLSRLKRR